MYTQPLNYMWYSSREFKKERIKAMRVDVTLCVSCWLELKVTFIPDGESVSLY